MCDLITTFSVLLSYSGETPLDCAPATLQYKMKKKMEEDVMHG